MKTCTLAIATLLLGAVAAAPLGAQSVTVEDVSESTAGGSTATFESPGIGRQVIKRLQFRLSGLRGSSPVLRQIAILGSNEFAFDLDNLDLPLSVSNNRTFELVVSYSPSGPNIANGVLRLTVETDDGVSRQDTVLTVNLVGRVPAFGLSRVLQNGSRQQVPNGGGVPFGRKPLGVDSEVTMVLRNAGSLAGTITRAVVTGQSFRLARTAQFPIRLLPGEEQAFPVVFRPGARSVYSGRLSLESAGPDYDVELSGTGGDLLSFRTRSVRGDGTRVESGQTQSGTEIAFGAAATAVEIVGRNNNQTTELIESLSVTGPFRATTSPALPATLRPGEELVVNVEPSSPRQGAASGSVALDDAVFTLSLDIPALPFVRFSRAGGVLGGAQTAELGLTLAAAYPHDIAGSLNLEFESSEFGGGPDVVWANGGRQTSFTIAAGQTVASFAGGAASAELRTGATAGNLTVAARFVAEPWGVDVTPLAAPELSFEVTAPAIPDISFTQSGGTVDAAEQVSVGLILAAPYRDDLVGVLALRFETRAVVSDPAIQWASGGREARFEIPAGETQAAFMGGDATANAFQTGTVAGEIVIVPQLFVVPDSAPGQASAQAPGAVNVTPDSAPELRYTVMEGAPVLRRIALGSSNQGRLAVQVTGFATNRSVSGLTVRLQGEQGAFLRTPDLEADVSHAFTTYYGGNQSSSFGSQFTATVEFIADEGSFDSLDSLTVSTSNSFGTSNAVTLDLE